MSTYKETLEAQKRLLEIAYKKIKPGGYVCIIELDFQNPVLKDISIPIIYFMSSSKLPVLTKITKILGSVSAGVDVLLCNKKALGESLGGNWFYCV